MSKLSNVLSATALSATALVFLMTPAVHAEESPEAKKTLVRQVVEQVLNQGKLDLAEELVHDAGAFGPEWFRTTYRMRRSAFPDLTYRIEELIAEGDRVVCRFTAVGTPNGPVVLAPSDEPVEVSGVAIFEVRDGKIRSGWELTDMLGLMRKTGYTVQAPQASRSSLEH
ncbi:MAG: ester cyclase [Acidobacteriota bacterium]